MEAMEIKMKLKTIIDFSDDPHFNRLSPQMQKAITSLVIVFGIFLVVITGIIIFTMEVI